LILCAAVVTLLGLNACGNDRGKGDSANQDSRTLEKLALDFPLACVLWQNCTIAAFPDHNGKDPFCGKGTYGGHSGTDFASSWSEMDKGIEVKTAHSGVVLFAFDGKFDRCTQSSTEADCKNPVSPRRAGLNEGNTVCSDTGTYCNGAPCFYCTSSGNYLVLQHESGYSTLYGHLAKNSIVVKAGDRVTQGEIVAKLGSSGFSGGPHLHFEVLDASLQPLDPWFGPCNEAIKESMWLNQAILYGN